MRLDRNGRRALAAIPLVACLVAASCGGDDDGGGDDGGGAPGGAATSGGGGGGGGAPEVDRILFSGVTPNAGNWAIQVGVEFGLFEEQGVEVEMIYSDSSPAAMSALIGGSVQFTSTVYDSVVLAHQEADDLRVVADGYRLMPFDLIVGEGIETVEDLEGETCGGMNPPGVGDSLYVESMVEHASDGAVSYPDDFDITNVNLNGGSSLAALESGQVSCIAQLPPVAASLQGAGFSSLYQLEEVPAFQDLSFFGIVALDSWTQDNPAATQAFLRGYLASIAHLYDPANEDAVVELLARNAQLDEATAAEAYTWVERGGYPRDGVVASDILPRTIELMKDVGTVESGFGDDVPGLVDNSLVTEAYEALPDDVRDGAGPEGTLGDDREPA